MRGGAKWTHVRGASFGILRTSNHNVKTSRFSAIDYVKIQIYDGSRHDDYGEEPGNVELRTNLQSIKAGKVIFRDTYFVRRGRPRRLIIVFEKIYNNDLRSKKSRLLI